MRYPKGAYQRIMQDMSAYIARRFGVAVDAALHAPRKLTDEEKAKRQDGREDNGNYHCHLNSTTRTITETGELDQKVRRLDDRRTGALEIRAVRDEYERLVNAELAQAGIAERMDLRSYAERGMDIIPTQHLGHKAAAMERHGIRTERGDLNREIMRVRELAIHLHDIEEQLVTEKQAEEETELEPAFVHDDEAQEAAAHEDSATRARGENTPAERPKAPATSRTRTTAMEPASVSAPPAQTATPAPTGARYAPDDQPLPAIREYDATDPLPGQPQPQPQRPTALQTGAPPPEVRKKKKKKAQTPTTPTPPRTPTQAEAKPAPAPAVEQPQQPPTPPPPPIQEEPKQPERPIYIPASPQDIEVHDEIIRDYRRRLNESGEDYEEQDEIFREMVSYCNTITDCTLYINEYNFQVVQGKIEKRYQVEMKQRLIDLAHEYGVGEEFEQVIEEYRQSLESTTPQQQAAPQQSASTNQHRREQQATARPSGRSR